MNRNLALTLWAIPYSLRWTLSLIGVNLNKMFPTMVIATTKSEEALQQGIAVLAFAVVAILTLGELGWYLAIALGAIKAYNLVRIDMTK